MPDPEHPIPARTDLPGVGTRFTLALRSGGRLEVVTYAPDHRELYLADGESPLACVRLEADEACTLATLLCEALGRVREG